MYVLTEIKSNIHIPKNITGEFKALTEYKKVHLPHDSDAIILKPHLYSILLHYKLH